MNLKNRRLEPVCPVAAFGRFKSRKYCKNAAGGTDNILFNKKRQSIKGSSAAGWPLQQTLQILKQSAVIDKSTALCILTIIPLEKFDFPGLRVVADGQTSFTEGEGVIAENFFAPAFEYRAVFVFETAETAEIVIVGNQPGHHAFLLAFYFQKQTKQLV